MKNIFNSIKLTKPKKNAFDLTHDVKLSCDMGNLVPVMCTECVPGDQFKISGEALIRFAPMVAPVMHRFDVSIHYFFVPNRIIWPNWEKWIIQGESETLAFPFITLTDALQTKLTDYMGIPPFATGNGYPVSALPFAAYQAIYNEYYRDQNLVAEVPYKLEDGDNAAAVSDLLALRKRAWEHDYFTAALPFAQKGPAVEIPLGDVVLKDAWDELPNVPVFQTEPGGTSSGAIENELGRIQIDSGIGGVSIPVAYNPNGSLQTESTSINDLRRAFRLQEWLEKNARGGTRYIENILVHFGVKSSDKRLQRPEYITGVKSPVVISEVLNTTGESAGLPQGNMAGHGVGVVSGKFGSYYCEEHGYIIGVMSIMPKTAYMNFIPKHFLKTSDQFEYFWPSFAHIGEQPIKNIEVYNNWDTATRNQVWGYVPRYAEYKYEPSRVAGDFRTSLDYWHVSRKFDTEAPLNQEFVECNPDKRIFAVTDEEQDSLYVHVLNKVLAIRPMPKFGNPMM